ncbi:hypothetical protein D5018_00765 [Parashewanella curva]|uniref:Uncharacterized protein n=1 Tax=Parashewanella curva TaxID=2338552 RepID=A0A3L8Q3W5_9GAMM|nr:hypothetical protein [Parashewanella curva]RLV61682.1 hypothetical protein D5018_00765 [Parashewanella curva]
MATSSSTATPITQDYVHELVMTQLLQQTTGQRRLTINEFEFTVLFKPKARLRKLLSIFTSTSNASFTVTPNESNSLQAKQIGKYIEQILLQEKIQPIEPQLKQENESVVNSPEATAPQVTDSEFETEFADFVLINKDSTATYDEVIICDSYQAFFNTTEGKQLFPVFQELNTIKQAESGILPPPDSYSSLRLSIKPPSCPFSGMQLTHANTVLFRLKASDKLLDKSSTENAMWIAASKTGVRLYFTQPQSHFPKLPAKYKPEYTKTNDVKQATREEVGKISLYAHNFIRK